MDHSKMNTWRIRTSSTHLLLSLFSKDWVNGKTDIICIPHASTPYFLTKTIKPALRTKEKNDRKKERKITRTIREHKRGAQHQLNFNLIKHKRKVRLNSEHRWTPRSVRSAAQESGNVSSRLLGYRSVFNIHLYMYPKQFS